MPEEFRPVIQSDSRTRDSLLAELRDSEEVATQLIRGVSEMQGNWQPQGGRGWSIWQCLEHLALTNQIYREALRKALASSKAIRKIATGREIRPGWFGSWFLSKVEPPVGITVKTKPKATPGARGDLAEAIARFVESHEPLREIIMSWDSVDLNRVRYPNPFIPLVRFTVGTGLLIANAHDRRHLWQAQRVKEAPEYPKA